MLRQPHNLFSRGREGTTATATMETGLEIEAVVEGVVAMVEVIVVAVVVDAEEE